MVEATDIQGGNSVEEAAKIFMKILNGEGTWAAECGCIGKWRYGITLHRYVIKIMMKQYNAGSRKV
jgi:anthranilate phosphoribosyltransferase